MGHIRVVKLLPTIAGFVVTPQARAADLVTEMTKVKHPMDLGRKGQRGIEW